MASEDEESAALRQMLSQLDIEPCFHSMIMSACSNKVNYVEDIEAQDLEGKTDANGDAVPAAVARGLVRMLRRPAKFSPDSSTPSESNGPPEFATLPPACQAHEMDGRAKSNPNSCSVSLLRGSGEYCNFLRCSIRGEFPGSSRGKWKVLTAILDNSASMKPQWPLVVDAISRVFTNRLLQDEGVYLVLIVFNTNAHELKLSTRRTAQEITFLLKGMHAPRGITNFERAFERAQECISRAVNALCKRGIPIQSIDLTTLLFTDGRDTSVPPLGCTSQAATNKARKAGDKFHEFLSSLQCRSRYTSIAAFGEHHDPSQCQYLSDRYFYINRPEVLSEWLSDGLAEMLESSGFCSVTTTLPLGLHLVEPLPKTITLEDGGHVAYEIWLSVDEVDTKGFDALSMDKVGVTADDGQSTLSGTAALSLATTVDSNCLDGRLFLLDWGDMQLRQIALSLAGGRPSLTKLASLRERLAGVNELMQPVFEVANDPKALLSGRTLLLARLGELDTRRNRLSYALGHFEEEDHGDSRKMGVVGIEAVLRDVSQRSAASTTAKQLRRVEAAAELPPPEELTEYGKKFARCTLSGWDATQVAIQGDALFYPVFGGIKPTVEESTVSFDVFALLSNKGKVEVNGALISHIGIPAFASPGHFNRAQLVMRDVLKRLSPDNTYTQGTSELLLVDLLGKHLQLYLTEHHGEKLASPAEMRHHGMIHRARSVAAVLASAHTVPSGRTPLEVLEEEASHFLASPEKRANVKDIYRTMALGLLGAGSGWSTQRFMDFGNAVIDECIRRAISRGLSELSDLDRLKVAWGLLGPPMNGDQWLDCPIQKNANQTLHLKKFCFQSVASDLRDLEERSPGQHSPRTSTLVCQILASKPLSGTPPIAEWSALTSLISLWREILDRAKPRGLWEIVDELMMKENTSILADAIGKMLESEPPVTTLRDALPGDPKTITSRICLHCIIGSRNSNSSGDNAAILDQPLRLALAGKVASLVDQRAHFALTHPIHGAAYPTTRRVSAKEMQLWWGSAAQPVDKQLYREVRRSIHRRNRRASLVVKEALTDKAYRKQGGNFEFPSEFDTFIPGLHRRTRDLHDAWLRKGKQTRGAKSRENAVGEILLRLRWDHRDDHARLALSRIVASIWDGLHGIVPDEPIPSALWMDGEENGGDCVPDVISTTVSQAKEGTADDESTNADWSVLSA